MTANDGEIWTELDRDTFNGAINYLEVAFGKLWVSTETEYWVRNLDAISTEVYKGTVFHDQNFNNIHDRFTQILKENFPILTANDIKMCAYLRMNLSTKEIASILNISVRGVEISRYRLRKKMSLENGVNLTEYLSKL